MATKPCKDCGGQVSPNAKACPHCGSKAFNTVNQITQGLLGCGCLCIVLAILIGIAVAVVGGSAAHKQHSAKPHASQSDR
jgi:hypothetical protein